MKKWVSRVVPSKYDAGTVFVALRGRDALETAETLEMLGAGVGDDHRARRGGDEGLRLGVGRRGAGHRQW